MMAAEHHYVYTDDGLPPRNATHVSIHESITVIPNSMFYEHPNIIELTCHDRVRKIEVEAFCCCPRLKRLVLPGVEELEGDAFLECEAVVHVECGKLEIIRKDAFGHCSFREIDLSSARIIERFAFSHCQELIYVKFGKNLESIGEGAFSINTNLRFITIPLKNGLFAHDDVFAGCKHFNNVFLTDGDEVAIQETIDAFIFDDWKNDMSREIHSINQTLRNARAGGYGDFSNIINGGKTRALREWIGRVLQKIIHFKVEHYRVLSLAAAVLAHASPNEIVIDSVFSFLELPDHVFEGEGESSATTPAFDRQLWKYVVQMEQRGIEMERELNEKDDRICQLELRVKQLEQQVAEASVATTRVEGAFDPSNKRQRAN